MKVDYTTMTEQQLMELIDDANQEILRRQNIETVNREVSVVLRRARLNGVVETPTPGSPWVPPTGAHDAYMAGDVQTHNGKRWESTVDNNVWEPGVSGWREKPENGGVPEYVQPTGGHDAYNTGELATFNGDVYKALQDGLVWSPADYPQGWEKQ